MSAADAERLDTLESKITALFAMMAEACGAAGLRPRLEAVEERQAAQDEAWPAWHDATRRVDAIERGIVSAYQAAHWPAGHVPEPPRDRHGLHAVPDGES